MLDRVYGHRSCSLVEKFVFGFETTAWVTCVRVRITHLLLPNMALPLCVSIIFVRLKHHLANYSIIPRLYNRANRHAWGWRPRNPWWHWYLQRTRVDRHRETRMHQPTELREICKAPRAVPDSVIEMVHLPSPDVLVADFVAWETLVVAGLHVRIWGFLLSTLVLSADRS